MHSSISCCRQFTHWKYASSDSFAFTRYPFTLSLFPQFQPNFQPMLPTLFSVNHCGTMRIYIEQQRNCSSCIFTNVTNYFCIDGFHMEKVVVVQHVKKKSEFRLSWLRMRSNALRSECDSCYVRGKLGIGLITEISTLSVICYQL